MSGYISRYGWALRAMVLLAMGLTLSVMSCGSKDDPILEDGGNEQDGMAEDGQNDQDEDQIDITYTAHIKSILDASCTGCHSTEKQGGARNGAPVGVDFNSYADSVTSASRGNVRIQAGTMPPGGAGIAQSDRELFQQWIDQGSLE